MMARRAERQARPSIAQRALNPVHHLRWVSDLVMARVPVRQRAAAPAPAPSSASTQRFVDKEVMVQFPSDVHFCGAGLRLMRANAYRSCKGR